MEALTPREVQIMRLIAKGNKPEQIAIGLGIAEQTLKNHLSDIYSRLGVKNRRDAVMVFIEKYLMAKDEAFEPMLTPGDVAFVLHIGINTVRRWEQKGILKGYKIGPRGDRRFRRKDIERFLKERQIGDKRR